MENICHNFCVMLDLNNIVMMVVTLNYTFRHVYRFSAHDAMNFMELYKCPPETFLDSMHG